MIPGVWRLRTYLAALLVVTTLVTIGIVGGAMLLVRIPQIEQESQKDVARDADELKGRVEILLGSVESRMELLGQLLLTTPLEQANSLLDQAVGDEQSIRSIYLASGQGTVIAVGVAPGLKALRHDLLGSDLSANSLYLSAREKKHKVWGDKYLSGLSGVVTVGLAIPLALDQVLLVEVPLTYLLRTVQVAAGQSNSNMWLVDSRGEIIADTEGGHRVGTVNLLSQPVMGDALEGRSGARLMSFEGKDFYTAVSHSEALEWYFIGSLPAGLDNPEIRRVVIFVVQVLLGSLLVGLILAPFLAPMLTRPLRGIMARAEQITQGAEGGPWPQGPIAEFNSLSTDIEKMAVSLQEREQKLLEIFNASPVPMAVTVEADGLKRFKLLDVNQAWCTQFDRKREDVLGLDADQLGLWVSPVDGQAMVDRLQSGSVTGEAELKGGGGKVLICQIFGRLVQIGSSRLNIWANVDISYLRRLGNELRELNAELENRVIRRTEALGTLNEELAGANAVLQQAQAELVRAEKMAALGSLVAGVAHELNTPLGNALMATTTMSDDTRQFRRTMQEGLRRSDLDGFVSRIEQASDISTRNLQRAADLVRSFKQVAVDQTSSQRRIFELGDVVGEIVSSLRPSLSRTPYQILVEVPRGLLLDSYPGALGQAIGNLINNAVMHGFEGRSHGVIRIVGERADNGNIALRVIDDGQGIPPALLDRIFDPFVTTKMGRGGTGLGLHISYNAVTNLLGGHLSVESVVGEGATFLIQLPERAPVIKPEIQ